MDGPSTSTASTSGNGNSERALLSRFLFSRQSTAKKGTADSSPKQSKKSKEEERGRDRPLDDRPPESPRTRFTNFATRSIRKSQWKFFKHKAFFGSTQGSTSRPLKPPKLTVRLPSADEAELEILDGRMGNGGGGPQMRARRNTTSDSSATVRTGRGVGLLGDSGDSSGFVDEPSPMALPATPLSASSSISEGWKYSSQKILWKLKKPRNMPWHASSTSASSSTDSAWRSQDSATWRSVDGSEVVLRGSRLEHLSPAERAALRSVATAALARMLPGISLHKQKEFPNIRIKRQKMMKPSRNLGVGEPNRRPSSGGSTDDERRSVFGVSLSATLEWERSQDAESKCQSLDDSAVSLCVPPTYKKSGRKPKPVQSEPEIVTATEEEGRWLYPQNQSSLHQRSLPLVASAGSPPPLLGSSVPLESSSSHHQHHHHPSSSSPPPPSSSTTVSTPHHLNHHSLDTQQYRSRARGFSTSLERQSVRRESCAPSGSVDTEPHQLAVPRIVDSCTSYLIQHGLHTVGLFRVAGSAKRCRMLRMALEAPVPSIPHSDQLTPHDVATVLKEYLRDLPQSLLPREHYQAWMAAARLSGEERLTCCRLLISLLPPANADTLLVLLRCLHTVSEASQDTVDQNGKIVTGNRMDDKNLATVFAPCILRPNHEKLHSCLADSDLQIGIVETMLRHLEDLYTVPKELQNKLLTKMRETEPERLDRILSAMARNSQTESTDCPFPSPFPTLEEERAGRRKQSVGFRRSDSWPNSLGDDLAPGQESSSQQPSTSSYTEERDEAPAVDDARLNTRRHTRRDTHAIIVGSISAVALRASAARRRLRNVFRAFRLTSRSTPNVSTQSS